jgi:hypothetical protein
MDVVYGGSIQHDDMWFKEKGTSMISMNEAKKCGYLSAASVGVQFLQFFLEFLELAHAANGQRQISKTLGRKHPAAATLTSCCPRSRIPFILMCLQSI